jgi:hypothetical protein
MHPPLHLGKNHAFERCRKRPSGQNQAPQGCVGTVMALGYCALDTKAMNACCGLVTTDAYILILFAAWSDYMVARKWEFRCEKPHTDSTETQITAVLSLCYGLGWLYGFFVNERGSEIELAIKTKKLFFVGPAPDTACTTATGISYRCEVDIVVRANASFS